LDHILGFFRIWSIPVSAVDATLGRFIPALPVTLKELKEKGIAFDHKRYCRPYITDKILTNLFKEDAAYVKDTFLDGLEPKPQFDTQQKVLEYFNKNKIKNAEQVKQGLFDLISNVIFIEEPASPNDQFHFNIAMDKTSSFQSLDEKTKKRLKELYEDYFYKRQEKLWRKEGRKKLSVLKKATNMLVCGEDLGMAPACVPAVLKELKILSLEVQRMPKKFGIEFSDLNNAPYLSVVTPATHDMSTIREWWEEDRGKSQRFYNTMLHHEGQAPYFCEPEVMKEIISHHLKSPAMMAIFQIQDLMGIDGKLRRKMPQEERINQPANANHNWKYRMHITLEELMERKDFNNELRTLVNGSGR
jgi:4-alpha-glucanotransferase